MHSILDALLTPGNARFLRSEPEVLRTPVPQPIPQPRVDTLVMDPASGSQRRRSDYSGTAWFASGGMIRGEVREGARFVLPDSLPYWRARLDDAVVACSVALQVQTGYPNTIVDPHAEWVPDPRDDDLAWLQLSFDVEGRDPLGVSYRVTALCAPGAIAQSGR
jgi:hypothetical protein